MSGRNHCIRPNLCTGAQKMTLGSVRCPVEALKTHEDDLPVCRRMAVPNCAGACSRGFRAHKPPPAEFALVSVMPDAGCGFYRAAAHIRRVVGDRREGGGDGIGAMLWAPTEGDRDTRASMVEGLTQSAGRNAREIRAVIDRPSTQLPGCIAGRANSDVQRAVEGCELDVAARATQCGGRATVPGQWASNGTEYETGQHGARRAPRKAGATQSAPWAVYASEVCT
ncbi:hypothetical protein FB451DRAFT_1185266 [Mycena latifolia]|nr:hypothetical protein FB451DRAFT_1185266 [Mycena latifolia]